MDRLRAWKESPRRMPLLLDGARQVGKTYTALTFGKEQYKNTVYFNMEDSSEIRAIFERGFQYRAPDPGIVGQSRSDDISGRHSDHF